MRPAPGAGRRHPPSKSFATAAESRASYTPSVAATYSYRFGRNAPFAPSNARTEDGGFISPDAFPSAEYCGHCHAAAYAQWKDSLHRNSFREPFYTKNVDLLNNGKGIEFSRHCEGCHNPIALLSGALTPHSTLTRTFDDTGITCTVCHSITALSDPARGTGAYVMSVPAVMTDARGNRVPGLAPDADILAHPDRHVRAVMQPFYRTAEFCAACHNSVLPAYMSGYKALNGFSTYDEWDASSYSHRSPLGFHDKPQATCQSCHMAPEAAGAGEMAGHKIAQVGLGRKGSPGQPSASGARGEATLGPAPIKAEIASHRWLGGNTAVPFYYGEAEQLARTTEFLQRQRLEVQIAALTPAPPVAASPMGIDSGALALPAVPDGPLAALHAGETVVASVLVSNIGLGHSLIPEQRDIYQAWVDFTAASADGKPIWESGALAPDGHLDPAAHSFTNRLISADGKVLSEHQIWERRAVAYDDTIPSGQVALVRYEFRLPAGVSLPLTLSARVRYRHFNQHYADFALGSNHPAYPVVTMASASAAFSTTRAPANAADWSSLGVALLAQSDYAGARAAFEHALALRLGDADGFTNLAIAELGLNRYDAAQRDAAQAVARAQAESDRRAEARALYYRGLAERNQDGALAASEGDLDAAAALYPGSRQLMRDAAFAQYLENQNAPARAAFAALVAASPYDLLGHYYLAVLDQRAGLTLQAATQSAIYEDWRARPGEAAIALDYLHAHPEVWPESVAGHVHMQPGLEVVKK